MIVRRLEEVRGSRAEVSAPTWVSRRLLLAGDQMGFSLHDTIMRAGTATRMRYSNHLEAVYCIAGRGTIELIATGQMFEIFEGTMYALDENDEHVLRAQTELRLICVFNPPVVGAEVHDETGAYPRSVPQE